MVLPVLSGVSCTCDLNISVAYRDKVNYPANTLQLHSDGLCLKTRCFFEIGTEMIVAFSIGNKTTRIKGVVVSCEPEAHSNRSRSFVVTLFFPSLSSNQRRYLLEASRILAGSIE